MVNNRIEYNTKCKLYVASTFYCSPNICNLNNCKGSRIEESDTVPVTSNWELTSSSSWTSSSGDVRRRRLAAGSDLSSLVVASRCIRRWWFLKYSLLRKTLPQWHLKVALEWIDLWAVNVDFFLNSFPHWHWYGRHVVALTCCVNFPDPRSNVFLQSKQ